VSCFSTRKSLVFILSLLVLTGLACGLGGQDQTPSPPGGSIPVSQEAAIS
jgi:hypothetical protein